MALKFSPTFSLSQHWWKPPLKLYQCPHIAPFPRAVALQRRFPLACRRSGFAGSSFTGTHLDVSHVPSISSRQRGIHRSQSSLAPAVTSTDGTPPNPFEQLGLSKALAQNLLRMDISTPTHIQVACIPEVLAGRDVIGQAETGSGKTAAYMLPLLNALEPTELRTRVLVILPTRELCEQVASASRSFSSTLTNVKTVSITGGNSAKRQVPSFTPPPHVLVATPGRLLDHLDRGSLSLEHVSALVVDEADRLYDMNFGEQLEKIITYLPTKRQTLLFSATFPPALTSLTQTLQPNYFSFRPEQATIPDTVEHFAVKIRSEDSEELYSVEKMDELQRLLLDLCANEDAQGGIIFCNTRDRTNAVANELYRLGMEVATLHGGMEQHERNESLVKLRCKTLHVLVATDVAARGLDVDSLSFVIHLELPRDLQSFMHRCGRVGRAGKNGSSYILAEPLQFDTLDDWRNNPDESTNTIPEIKWLDRKPRSILSGQFSVPKPKWRLLVILGGKKDKLRKGDIIGGITGETNLRGDEIGNIEIAAGQSFVAVPYAQARSIQEQINNARIKKVRRRVHLIKN